MTVEFEEYQESSDNREFDWTLQEGSNSHKILAFLAEHPDQGFTPKEIHDATGVTRGSVGKTLQRLEERQLVRHAEPYWAIGENDRVGTYLSMVSSLETISQREGTEDYDEWRNAANSA
ncbi:MarR family transcriptional regulator [Haloquadratum walsbyi]|jgi:DNA-binding MarR family transcriptional regulator|uniref:MarR family transcriptional regulator n=1 Tax=Haloquadratum walsbyi TaxID=293091 RepID=UPI0015F482CE|nr:helix-turn-helix domain-containing protein [Haloquadratum walsbyi]